MIRSPVGARQLAEQPEHDAAAVTDDVELPGLIDAEGADVAELRAAAELRGVLDEPAARRFAAGPDVQADRPDALPDVVGEEVSPAVGGAQRAPR